MNRIAAFLVALAAAVVIASTLTRGTYVPDAVVKIEEQTPVGTNAVTFSALGSYTSLRVIWLARTDAAATTSNLQLTFNSDSGSNYDREAGLFSGTTAGATQDATGTFAYVGTVTGASAPSDVPGLGEILIPDYRGTTLHKGAIFHNHYKTANSLGNIAVRNGGISWRSAAAIMSASLTLSAGNFTSGSRFSLYGVK